jgi:hypothetical protein
MQPLSLQRQPHHIPVTHTQATLPDNLTEALIHSNSTNQVSLTTLVPNRKGKRRQQHRLVQHNIIQTNNTAKANINIRLIITPKAKPQPLVLTRTAAEHPSQPGGIMAATMRNNQPRELLQIQW